jgi:hypothetical protein
MALTKFLSLEEAARCLGTTQDEVQRWIDEGFLVAWRQIECSSNQASDAPPSEIQVNEDELWEVAETIGWLRLSAESWDNAKDDQ